MNYAIVIRNVIDLRAGPVFRSERKSQLLFNEPLAVSQTRDGYCRVYQDDGYNGWVDRRALHFLSSQKCKRYIKKLDFRVAAKTARIIPLERGAAASPPFIFYGTRLCLVGEKGHFGYAVVPDNSLIRISLRNISPLSAMKRRNSAPEHIIDEARKFLGVPYLWGGITPFGLDCSGLVQSVFRAAGINLPRDSKDQMKAGREIARGDIGTADLLFFPGHVAVAVNRSHIIHASLAEGGVAINSLIQDEIGFRGDLKDSFVAARRLLR